MLERILTRQQEDLLSRERTWLTDLQVILAKLGATEEDQLTLKNSIQQLDDLFLLVIVGEFNAGKSAFINALLGQSILKEGVTPTTAQVNIVRYGETVDRQIAGQHLHILTAPVAMLQHLNIVDTPGTNAIIREHQAITEDFVPRSDLVLFITSADRPFTESERQFLNQIKEWGKKVVIVINKIDIYEQQDDVAQVLEFVRDNSRSMLGLVPEIFPVSARLAQRAKNGDSSQWASSGFEALEAYIYNTLDETKRVQLKFLNPHGIGDRLLAKYLDVTNNRLALLADDFTMLDQLERQNDLYRQDLKRDFKLRLSDIENILYEMERRGSDFFDETMRLARVVDLMNKDRIQREFEHKVVADTPQLVEKKVNELIDWLVSADLNQWQAVMQHINERKQTHEDEMIGEVGANFRYDRDRLIDSVGRSAQRVVDTYDKRLESEQIAESARMAVAASAVMEAGALGLGALITALATTVAADVTGLIAASVVAALGLFIIPARRRAAQKEMADKIAVLRKHLVEALSAQFERELERSVQQINEAIAPYTRFVRAERTKLEQTKENLIQAGQTQGKLRAEIEAM